MSYSIVDFDQYQIYITDGLREYYIPKFRLSMTVSEPNLTLVFNASERGGHNRKLIIDYRDVESYGYDIATSAADLKDIIEAMQVSGWTNINTGDLLNAKGDLLSHDGISDAILPVGTNGRILMADSGETTGLIWQDPSLLFSGKTAALIIPTITGANSSMTDGATYYWGSSGAFGANSNQGLTRIYNLTGKTITIVAVSTFIRWTPGTSESASVYLRYNNTTDYLIGTVDGDVQQTELSLTGQSIAWASGDYVEMKMVNPTWATNPSNMNAGGQIHCLSPIS